MNGIERVLAFDRRARFRAFDAAVCWGVAGSVGALIAIGALILSRRVASALTEPLPTLALVMTLVVVGVVVFGGRVVWRGWALSRERREGGRESVIGWGGSGAIVLLALGCSLGRGMDWLLWMPLVVADQWQLRWFLNAGDLRAPRGQGWDEFSLSATRNVLEASLIHPLIAAQGTTALRSGDFGSPVLGCSRPFEGGGLQLQRLIRVREADGRESIQGMLRAEFAAGQRQATLHVGFCPPLDRLPVVEAETCEGPDAEVKVAQTFAHGARLEVRLAMAAEGDCSVLVEMIAKPRAAGASQDGSAI